MRRRGPGHCWDAVLAGDRSSASRAHLQTCAGCARTVDLSDRQPPAFRATAEQGMWQLFEEFLRSR